MLAAALFGAASLSGATQRLYLKDGDYQLTNNYQVLADRVRYYSTERSDWEEIPLELVDLDRTKKKPPSSRPSFRRRPKSSTRRTPRYERNATRSTKFPPSRVFTT